MGILTDFFVASEQELAEVFSTLERVAPEKKRFLDVASGREYLEWVPESWKDLPEPIRIEPKLVPKMSFWQRVQSWFKPKPKIEISAVDYEPHYDRFEHYIQGKGVDLVMLAALSAIVCEISFEEALEQLEIPALLDPEMDNNSGVHCLPDRFTQNLAELSDAAFMDTAQKWAQTEEFEAERRKADEAQNILNILTGLASLAVQEKKHLYHWWSV